MFTSGTGVEPALTRKSAKPSGCQFITMEIMLIGTSRKMTYDKNKPGMLFQIGLLVFPILLSFELRRSRHCRCCHHVNSRRDLPALVERPKQLRWSNVKRSCYEDETPHAGVPRSEFDVGDVVSRHARPLGKLFLREITFTTQHGDALAEGF